MKREKEPKPPILHASPETKAKKQRLKNFTRKVNSLKRRRVGHSAKAISGNTVWKSLSIKDKESLVLNWSVNGGVIAGRRYNRLELSKALGLSEAAIEKLMETCQRSFEQMFENSQQMRQTVFAVAAKAIHQLQDNRARAIMHNDILDEELVIIRGELKAARMRKPVDPKEVLAKQTEIGRLMAYFRSVSYQKLESTRLLLDSTEGYSKFLEMFTSQKNGKMPGLEPEAPAPGEATTGDDYLDPKTAIALMSDHAASVLPSHKNLVFNQGPKNPNAGFEVFRGQEPVAHEQE